MIIMFGGRFIADCAKGSDSMHIDSILKQRNCCYFDGTWLQPSSRVDS